MVETAHPVALITGAAQGIGAAIGERFAADGYHVALNDRVASDGLEARARQLGGLAIPADVSDSSVATELVNEVQRTLGPVSVVVSNHATLTKRSLADSDPAGWWHEVETNLSGAFYVARATAPEMLARKSGAVIFISSCWGITGEPLTTAYSASKAGLISLTRSLARELTPQGISVNAVAPGVIDTPQLEVDAASAGRSVEAMRAEFARLTPLGRIGTPTEVAATVAFLAAPRARAFVGQVFQPNGGLLTCPA